MFIIILAMTLVVAFFRKKNSKEEVFLSAIMLLFAALFILAESSWWQLITLVVLWIYAMGNTRPAHVEGVYGSVAMAMILIAMLAVNLIFTLLNWDFPSGILTGMSILAVPVYLANAKYGHEN